MGFGFAATKRKQAGEFNAKVQRFTCEANIATADMSAVAKRFVGHACLLTKETQPAQGDG